MIVSLVTKFSSPIMRQRWLADFWRKNLFLPRLSADGESCFKVLKKWRKMCSRAEKIWRLAVPGALAGHFQISSGKSFIWHLWPFGGIFTGSEIEAHRQRRKSRIHRWHLCTVDHKSGVKMHFALFTFLIRTLVANGQANGFLPNLEAMFP